MIIDSHAHAFPPMGGPAGFASQARHASYTQHALAHQHLGGLSNGRTSQAVAGGKLVFRWNARPWRIEPGADLLAQLVGQLLVQRQR